MTSFILSKISSADLKNLVVIQERGIANYDWTEVILKILKRIVDKRLRELDIGE